MLKRSTPAVALPVAWPRHRQSGPLLPERGLPLPTRAWLPRARRLACTAARRAETAGQHSLAGAPVPLCPRLPFALAPLRGGGLILPPDAPHLTFYVNYAVSAPRGRGGWGR